VTIGFIDDLPGSEPFDIVEHRKQPPMVMNGCVYYCDDAVALWVQQTITGNALARIFGKLPVSVGIINHAISDEDAMRDGSENLQLNLPNWLEAGAYFYDHLPGEDIIMSVATRDPSMRTATPTMIKRVLEFPFSRLDLPRITALIRDSNKVGISNAKKLGFREEGRKAGTDILYFGLLRSECAIWNGRESLKLAAV
jgi:hypothetical protein